MKMEIQGPRKSRLALPTALTRPGRHQGSYASFRGTGQWDRISTSLPQTTTQEPNPHIKAAAGIVFDCLNEDIIDDQDDLMQRIDDDVARKIIELEFESLYETALAPLTSQINEIWSETALARQEVDRPGQSQPLPRSADIHKGDHKC